jgi:hypothetical protein
MNTLPMDVIKLLIDYYYTPIITTVIEHFNFYLILTYPSFSTKLELSKPFEHQYKGSQWYPVGSVEAFITSLLNNKNAVYHTENHFIVKISIINNYIKVEHSHTTVNINNTETVRLQLVEALKTYITYLDDMSCYL